MAQTPLPGRLIAVTGRKTFAVEQGIPAADGLRGAETHNTSEDRSAMMFCQCHGCFQIETPGRNNDRNVPTINQLFIYSLLEGETYGMDTN